MTLASPDKLIWLLAALPIIGFYILKTRLRRRPVSTLLFWEQVFEQKRQRTLWQNLRHWMSLLLQLIFIGFLGFAIADPLWSSQEDQGQDLILVVDHSASMQARDRESGKTRLEEAVEQASDLAGTLRPGDRIALVTAGSSVQVAIGMSDFAPTVQEALRTIEPTAGPTKIGEAVRAARRLASDDDRRRIVVLTDGCVADREAWSSLGSKASENEFSGRDAVSTGAESASTESSGGQAGVENESSDRFGDDVHGDDVHGGDVRWVQVGRSADNVAITTFQVRRSTVDPIGYSLLVEVQNFSDSGVETRLTLSLGEALVDVIPLEIEAGGSFRKQIDSTSRSGGVLRGELKIEDALEVDNSARAILPERPEIPVRLISGEDSPSYFLQRVLQSIPRVRILGPDQSTTPGLTVFAGVVPEQIPDGPVLLVDMDESGPPVGDPSNPAWILGDGIENPIIAKQEEQSPLLRHVQLQNVILSGGRDLDVHPALGAATVLLETASGARVCVSVERPQGRVLLLAADLDSSDLPLRIAFPVLMTNAMNWFLRETGEIQPALSTGRTVDLPWDVESGRGWVTANLISPRGDVSLVTATDNRVKLGPLSETGVYRLTTKELPEPNAGQASLPARASGEIADDEAGSDDLTAFDPDASLFAVNLTDANESDLRLPEIPPSDAKPLPPAGRSPWFYLILAASGLVLAEWALFQRRVVA